MLEVKEKSGKEKELDIGHENNKVGKDNFNVDHFAVHIFDYRNTSR